MIVCLIFIWLVKKKLLWLITGNFEIILEFEKDIYSQDHFFALSS